MHTKSNWIDISDDCFAKRKEKNGLKKCMFTISKIIQMLRIFACMLGMKNISSRNRKERHGKCGWACPSNVCIFYPYKNLKLDKGRAKCTFLKYFWNLSSTMARARNEGMLENVVKRSWNNGSNKNNIKKNKLIWMNF